MTKANTTLAVADNHESSKTEALTALYGLGNAVDVNQLFNQLFTLLFSGTTTTVITTATVVAITATTTTVSTTATTAATATTFGCRSASVSGDDGFTALSFCFLRHLELQSAFAGTIGERLDTPVEQETTTIEHDPGYTRSLGTFCNRLTNSGCGVTGCTRIAADILFKRRGGSHRLASDIVDDLRIDMPTGTMDGKPGTATCARHKGGADAATPLCEE
jgi:hypothetical protein